MKIMQMLFCGNAYPPLKIRVSGGVMRRAGGVKVGKARWGTAGTGLNI